MLIFVLTGGFAALVNVVTRFGLSTLVRYEIAVAVAYLCGMVFAFLLFRTFVFEQGKGWRGEAVRFTVVNIGSFGLVWVTSVGLARLVFPAIGFIWHAEDIAHLVGVSTPLVSSYYGHKHYSFRRSADLSREPGA